MRRLLHSCFSLTPALLLIAMCPNPVSAETSVDDFTAIVNTGSVKQNTQGSGNQQNLNVGSATSTKAKSFNANVSTGSISQSSSGSGIVQSTNIGSATNSKVGSFNATVTTGNIEQVSTRSGDRQELNIGSVTDSTVKGNVNLNVTVKQGVTQTGSGEVTLGSVKNSNVQNFSSNLEVKGKVTGSNIRMGSIVGQEKYDDRGRHQGEEQSGGNDGRNSLTLPNFTSTNNTGVVKQPAQYSNSNQPESSSQLKWYETLSNGTAIAGSTLDLLDKISSLDAFKAFLSKAITSREAIRSVLNMSKNVKAANLIDEYIRSFELLEKLDPKLYNKVLDSFIKSDYSELRSILTQSPKWAEKTEQIIGGAKNLGTLLSALSVTLDASELAAKVNTGTASVDDWAKFVSNTTVTAGGTALGMSTIGGAAVGGTGAATGGIVFAAAYASLQAGKALAELNDGISYSESQQTYIRNVTVISNGISELEISLTKKYSSGGQLDLKADAALITKSTDNDIQVVRGMLDNINSTQNLFTSAVAFESDERTKIKTALTNLLVNLTNTQLNAENIVLNQYRLGSSVYETNLKQEVVSKLM